MNTVLFEDVPLSVFDRNEMKNFFSDLSNKEKRYISFMNPEIMMQQQSDKNLHGYFVNSSANFIDGVNLLYAINTALGTKYGPADRFPGTDFFEYLPTNQDFRIFFYGAKKENCITAKNNIENKFKNIQIVDYIDGYTDFSDVQIVDRINRNNVDIVIVCLGCPKQELWIKKNIEKINTKIIFGNGGAIDFWSGKYKRAPQFIIDHGFEWLFRLFASFSWTRVKRQSKLAVFLFKYKFGLYKIE